MKRSLFGAIAQALCATCIATCIAALIAGCASAPPAPVAPGTQPAPLFERHAARLSSAYRLDAARSDVRIHVFRGGRMARLGHNHVLAVPKLAGLAWLDEGAVDVDARTDAGGAGFELEFRLDELELDRADQRAALAAHGGGWASSLSAEAIAATRTNMLGALRAARHPWVRLRSTAVAGALPKLVAELEIELHGQRRMQRVPLEVRRDGTALRVRGVLAVRQSDFGLEPFSVGAGLLAVRDELVVEFELLLAR